MKFLLLLLCLLLSFRGAADGIVVDKVYHPYVLPNETEVEWRLLSRQLEQGNVLGQRLAFGRALSERLTLEAYLVAEEKTPQVFSLQAYELELRWMLTEQGQYWADWGMLFEIEKQHRTDDWEVTSGVLMEKELGATSLTLNAFLVYEWGESLTQEIETEVRMQYRYRWLPEFQPAIEVYSGENYFGVGPACMGIVRIAGQRQVKWEAGFITNIDSAKKDHSFRLAIEYEF